MNQFEHTAGLDAPLTEVDLNITLNLRLEQPVEDWIFHLLGTNIDETVGEEILSVTINERNTNA